VQETETISFAGDMRLLCHESVSNIKLSLKNHLPSVSGHMIVVVKGATDVAVVSVDDCDVLPRTKHRMDSYIYFSYQLRDTHRLLKEQLSMTPSQT